MCLSMAQILGDENMQYVAIVGGLVPSIIFGDSAPHASLGAHIGTLDLDLGLDVAVLDEERYEDIAERLRDNGFAPDTKEETGALVRHRWCSDDGQKIDFVIAPSPPEAETGTLQNLTHDLAAIKMLGMDLALKYRLEVPLSGPDLRGRNVTRTISVCSAEIFVVLKALAMANRDKAKDAYDLYFVLLNKPGGPESVGSWLSRVTHAAVDKAIESLRRDFGTIDDRGPKDVCRFLDESLDEDRAANVLAQITALLEAFDSERRASKGASRASSRGSR